jgi:hypothetical protein
MTTELFQRREWQELQHYPKTSGDGQPATVWVIETPAPFYKIDVEDSVNSVGAPMVGLSLHTGSGEGQLARQIAQAFADGMLSLAYVNDGPEA